MSAAPKKPKTINVETNVSDMLASVQGVGEIPVVDLKNAKAEPLKNVLSSEDITLTIGTVRVVPIDPRAGLVIVQNISEGELYAGVELQAIGAPILPGETREVQGASVIHLASNSRPTARVTQYSK